MGFFIPKNKNIWVFGSWEGKMICDNSKVLFDYISGLNNSKVIPIFITGNRKLANNLKGIYFKYSPNGILYQLIASKYFLTTSYADLSIFSFFSPKKSIYVQLRHGTPFKKLKLLNWSDSKVVLHNEFKKFLGRQYDFVITTGEKSTSLLKNYFDESVKFLELGFPRNDILLKNMKPNKNIISIIPTFRPYNYSLINDINLIELNNLMKKYNFFCYIKLHPKELELYGVNNLGLSYSNLIISPDIDTYELCNITKILVTDYSSIFIDFLLKDNPIIFTLFDLDNYLKNVGLLFNYNELPGEIVKDKNKFLNILEEYLNGVDNYKNIRGKKLEDFYKNPYVKSSEQIFNYFINK